MSTFRAAGLEARWSKYRSGQPVIVVRDPNGVCAHQREQWWAVDASMFENMKRDGIAEAFHGHTLIGDIFSIAL